MAVVAARRAARRQLEAYDAAMFPWLDEKDRERLVAGLREAVMTPEEREEMYRENRSVLYRKQKVGGHG